MYKEEAVGFPPSICRLTRKGKVFTSKPMYLEFSELNEPFQIFRGSKKIKQKYLASCRLHDTRVCRPL